MKKYLLFCIALVCLLACKKGKEEIPIESVAINPSTAEMIEGETVQLKATVKPDDATDKTVQWASSRQSVATITDKGLVTAIAEGTSTITAKAGGKTASCQITVSKRIIEVTSVTLDKETLELTEGEEDTLTATVKPDDATDKTVEWSSSAPDIATVEGGKITAIKEGKATITAKAGEKTATCEVTVNKRFIPVEAITLDKTLVTMLIDESTVLTATVEPENATDKTVTWSSSDTDIATVSGGRVTSVQEGKAIITARAGDKEATCEINVCKRIIDVTSITLDYTELSLVKGEERQLVATVRPDDATDKTVTWSSSNLQVAKVDNKGIVTALRSGTAIITAMADEKAAECKVTVSTPVESISLDSSSLTLTEGESAALTATIIPDDADEKTVAWSSSDAKTATVDGSGKVTAVKAGSATITAKVGEKTATCSVTVEKKVIPVSSISLNTTSLTLEKGKSEKLTATVKPDDATDKTVTWSSSNTSVASVDGNGKVTAVAGGQAIITAKAGEQAAECSVKVTVPVTSVSIDPSSLSLEEGQSATLKATVSPSDADEKTVAWSSSNAGIAKVDDAGKVTAVKAGSATITAKVGEKTAACSVTVEAPAVTHTVVTYKEAEGEVLNPERGMYSTFEIHKASFSLSTSSVKAKVATGHTVQLLEFYLTDYMKRDISQDYLDMIQKCFDAMRSGGAKAIVRFAYKQNVDGSDWDPEVAQVLSHVAQLKPILQRNEDVLFVLQAGFVGVWGEWYYTTHFVMEPSSDADYEPRKQLTEALLDAVPTSRQIELRTPQFKMRMYKLALSDTLRAGTAHKGSALSRLAGHNDCFGADDSDMGTFLSNTDRKFWKAETRYTIMGGETCQVSNYCLCPQTLKDLEDYHWTYLHSDYNRDVLKRWEKDGCMDEIKARLGYRLVLQEVEYDSPRAGKPCPVTIRLKNKGFAAPMNPRQAYLVWKNANGGTQRIPLGSDPRTWHPGNTTLTVSFTPQSDRGSLYLELSDPLLPDNPAYSIALANQGVFDAQTGLNLLFQVQ